MTLIRRWGHVCLPNEIVKNESLKKLSSPSSLPIIKFNFLQPEFILFFKTSANSKLEKFSPLLSKTKTLL